MKSFVQLFAATTQLQEKKEDDVIESRDTIPAVAWLDMMYEESGLTQTRANEAASIIQVNKLNYKKLFYIYSTLYKIILVVSYFMPNSCRINGNDHKSHVESLQTASSKKE